MDVTEETRGKSSSRFNISGDAVRRRVFYTITRSEKAGAQIHVKQLVDHFRKDYELHLAVGEEGYLARVARESGVTTHVIPELIRAIRPQKDRAAYRRLKGLLAEIRPDLVHAHSFKAGCLARLAAQNLGLANVFTAHGWAFADGTRWSQRLFGIVIESLLARGTTRIITVSRADESLARRYRVAAADKIQTIHNALPYAPCPQPTDNALPRIICVARMARQKNHHCLLKAVATIKDEFRLDLIGDGPLAGSIHDLINQLGLNQRVRIIPNVEDVSDHLSQSDIFALSSRWEGLPVSILEAMRACLPVVATDVGGVSEMIEHEVNGLLAPRHDERAIATAVSRLIRDHSLRTRLGEAGRRRFEEDFLEINMIAPTADLYRTILGS